MKEDLTRLTDEELVARIARAAEAHLELAVRYEEQGWTSSAQELRDLAAEAMEEARRWHAQRTPASKP